MERQSPDLPQPNLLRVGQLSKDVLNTLDGQDFAYDFETYGLKFMDPEFFVRSVSFHNDEVSCAIELSDPEGNYYPGARLLFQWLVKQPGLIAHNAGFEAGVLYAMTDHYVPHQCTYALMAHVANEGSPGQRWGLKQLGEEVLGWEDWSTGIPKSEQMAKLPFEQLGWYNQVDSAATWCLYKGIKDAVKGHDWEQIFWTYFDEDLATQLELQFEAYRDGLVIDVEYTKWYLSRSEEELHQAEQKILTHPDIKPYVDKVNAKTLEFIQSKIDAAPEFTRRPCSQSRRE